MLIAPQDIVVVDLGDGDGSRRLSWRHMPRKSARRSAEVENMRQGGIGDETAYLSQCGHTAQPVGEVHLVVVARAMRRGRNRHLIALNGLHHLALVQKR